MFGKDAEAVISARSGFTGDQKWGDIADLIQRWGRRHPEAYQINMAYNEEVRADLKDKKWGELGGAKGEGGLRFGLAVHPELVNYIQAFYPTFLDTKEEMREFGHRFPAFKIPEKM